MPLRIEVLEPYDAVSHRLHWEGLQRFSAHEWRISSLPPRLWKFRMRTASIHFADQIGARDRAGESPPDLWVASEYLSVAEFLPLLPPRWRSVPVVVDFHENQLTYPLQPGEQRDHHFAFSHVHAGLAAARSIFHSNYHREEYLGALPALFRPVPDVDLSRVPERLRERSTVLPLGTDVARRAPKVSGEVPVLLWNHRFEYDKGPAAFLNAIRTLLDRGGEFRVRLLGQRFRKEPEELATLRGWLGDRLLADGWIESREQYLEAVASCDVALSTADHEFFGLAALEAVRLGLIPVFPDDLAYPELLDEPSRRFPLLYDRRCGVADALEAALRIASEPSVAEWRTQLVESTDRFLWSVVAPRYDALCEQVVAESRRESVER